VRVSSRIEAIARVRDGNPARSRWWIVALRGLVAIAFGVSAFLAPEKTLVVLVSMFGVFALADAIFAIGAGLAANWLFLFLDGIVGGGVGFLTLFYAPAAQPWFVATMIVAWAFVTGVLEVAGAVGLRHVISRAIEHGEWLLGASGVITLVFGGLMIALPPNTTATFAWTVGSYAVVSGLLLVALALNIRHWPHAAIRA
jgi:uncharacterized membrane protein HdeD (DUF308 family)